MLTHRYWLTIGKVNARRDGRVYQRILAATPFFYMDPQWLMVMALFQGGTLFVARRQSASRFMDWVRAHRINFTLYKLGAVMEGDLSEVLAALAQAQAADQLAALEQGR